MKNSEEITENGTHSITLVVNRLFPGEVLVRTVESNEIIAFKRLKSIPPTPSDSDIKLKIKSTINPPSNAYLARTKRQEQMVGLRHHIPSTSLGNVSNES